MITISLLTLLFLTMGTITYFVRVGIERNSKQAVPVLIRNDVPKRRRHQSNSL